MKKLIALAVAGVVATPVMAADVTVSGGLSQFIIDDSAVTAADGGTRNAAEQYFGITATSEGANGLSIKGYLGFTGGDAVAADGGDGITLSHASFGSVSIGNPASAVDSVDDKTEVLEVIDPVTGNTDADILWKLPTMVDGLTLAASYTADRAGADAAGADATFSGFNMGAETDQDGGADATSFAFAYEYGPARLAYGVQDEAAEENTFLGLQVKMGGLMIAYETNEANAPGAAAANQADNTAVAMTYTMGDIQFAYMATDTDTAGVTTNDHTGYGVTYNLGGGASAVLEFGEDNDANATVTEYTAVGLQYSF